MLQNSSEYVFNLDALMFGGAMLFLILIVHATYMFLVNRQYQAVTDRLMDANRYGLVQPFFYLMAFVLAISHLLEIFIWGYALSLSGLVPNSHQAMIFAGSAYTTVGFGSNPLPVNWDLVMVVIALTGMVTFGWSISVLFGMTQTVHVAHLKLKMSLKSKS